MKKTSKRVKIILRGNLSTNMKSILSKLVFAFLAYKCISKAYVNYSAKKCIKEIECYLIATSNK